MGASLNPSSGNNPSNWWTNTKVVAAGTAAATTAATTNQIQRSARKNRKELAIRCERQQDKLRTGKLNPAEFITQQSIDRYRPEVMKSRLQAWGGTWQGTSFADPTNFSIERGDGDKGPLGLLVSRIDPYYVLKIKNFEESVEELGRRGGATFNYNKTAGDFLEAQPIESAPIAENSLTSFMNNQMHQWSSSSWPSKKLSAPNPIYQLCEDRPEKWKTYTIAYEPSSLAETAVGSLFLSFLWITAILVAGGWVWQRFLSRNGENKANETPSLKNVDLPEEFNSIKRSEIILDNFDPIVRAATASDSLLKVLTAFHHRTITKDVALSLLKTYHNKTENEAMALLDTKRCR